jgi:O-antigen/teichoic acid export membrane protein
LLLPALGDEPGVYAALVGMCVVSAAQFLLRGLLLGQGAYRTYATVMVVDATLRVVLAAAVAVALPSDSASVFGWTLPVAVALAHVPLLILVVRRRPTPAPLPLVDPSRRSDVARAVGQLTVASLCGQALLNAAPVLVAGVAAPDQRLLAAQFVVCFTLVRVPLFVAVPLQSALIPGLTELQRTGSRRAVSAALRRLVLGTVALCVLGALIGLFAGPTLVALLFGDRYALPAADFALLAVGSALYVGLLVAGQALVAGARHLAAAVAWCTGLVAAAVVFVFVPGLVARAGLSFAAGSGVAFLTAAALVLDRATRSTPVDAGARPGRPAEQAGPA